MTAAVAPAEDRHVAGHGGGGGVQVAAHPLPRERELGSRAHPPPDGAVRALEGEELTAPRRGQDELAGDRGRGVDRSAGVDRPADLAGRGVDRPELPVGGPDVDDSVGDNGGRADRRADPHSPQEPTVRGTRLSVGDAEVERPAAEHGDLAFGNRDPTGSAPDRESEKRRQKESRGSHGLGNKR